MDFTLDTPIASGNTAQIYFSNDKIIKVYNDSLPDGVAAYEAKKQEYAYSKGLSVPKVLDVCTMDGKEVIVMEFIDGRTLGDMLLENKERAEFYMNLSIDIQQQIHKIAADSNSLEPMSAKLSRQITASHQLKESQKGALLEKLNGMAYEKRLCHGDFHLFNLIMSDNDVVTVIDWVDASAGDFRADVYRTYLLYSQYSMDLAELYLHLYCTRSGLAREDVMQWAPIIAGARLSENVSSENNERLIKIVKDYCPT